MGPWGALVMGFFGGVFWVAATWIAVGWRTPLLVVPLIVFAVIAFSAWRRISHATPGAYAPDGRAGKIIMRSSIGEGIGIVVVALGLANTGHQAVVLPGVALVVGLHFLPMASWIPVPRFYWIAAVLILAAVIGFLLPQPTGSALAGGVSALALWVACAIALRARPRVV